MCFYVQMIEWARLNFWCSTFFCKLTHLWYVIHITVEDSTVFTYELNSYNQIGNIGYNHRIYNDCALQFVCEDDGSVYTNNIDGFWSHFHPMITGCYHDVFDEHLHAYIDEACFRWNTRKASESERFSDMFNKSIGLIVTWSELKLCKVA